MRCCFLACHCVLRLFGFGSFPGSWGCGAVERKDVSNVSELRALPEDELVVVNEKCFVVVRTMRRSDGAVLANSGNHRKCSTVRSASVHSSGLTTIARLSGSALGLATTAS